MKTVHHIAGFALSLAAAPASAQLRSEQVPSYAAAKTIATGALDACAANGYRVSVTVVDRDGETVAQFRGDRGNDESCVQARLDLAQDLLK